jgi:MFS transporter, DHA2 family, methylenomycin A resistance protein
MFGSLSVVAGPIVGGVLVDQFGWPSIFLINLPLGLVTLAIGFGSIRETSDPAHTSLDLLGQLFGIVWLGALSFALIAGRSDRWVSVSTLAILAVASVAFVAFIIIERRSPQPMLPIQFFRDARFTVTNVASFLLGFGSFAMFFFLSLYLQQVQGYSATAAGLRFLPLCGAIMLVSVVSGRLTGHYGPRWPMAAGYGFTGIGLFGMCLFEPHTSDLVVGLIFAVTGLGMGLALPATNASAFIAVPRQRSGIASATVNATRQTGTALGVAVLGGLIGSGAFCSGFHASALIAGGVSLAAAALVLRTTW